MTEIDRLLGMDADGMRAEIARMEERLAWMRGLAGKEAAPAAPKAAPAAGPAPPAPKAPKPAKAKPANRAGPRTTAPLMEGGPAEARKRIARLLAIGPLTAPQIATRMGLANSTVAYKWLDHPWFAYDASDEGRLYKLSAQGREAVQDGEAKAAGA